MAAIIIVVVVVVISMWQNRAGARAARSPPLLASVYRQVVRACVQTDQRHIDGVVGSSIGVVPRQLTICKSWAVGTVMIRTTRARCPWRP